MEHAKKKKSDVKNADEDVGNERKRRKKKL